MKGYNIRHRCKLERLSHLVHTLDSSYHGSMFKFQEVTVKWIDNCIALRRPEGSGSRILSESAEGPVERTGA